MARRKQRDPFSYTTNLDPATAIQPNPNSGNLHGLDISDDDLPDFNDRATRVIDALNNRVEEALAESEKPQPLTSVAPAVNKVAAVVPSTLPAPSEDGCRIVDAHTAVAFMLAGNAYFTLRSARTGTRYTYRVSAAKPKEGGCNWCKCNPCRCPQVYFVSLLSGSDNESDYQYMGMVKERMFRRTKNSRITETAPAFKAFNWAFTRLVAGMMPAELEFWHEGRCGRCGRKLTVPESIAAGIGPECASYMSM